MQDGDNLTAVILDKTQSSCGRYVPNRSRRSASWGRKEEGSEAPASGGAAKDQTFC